MGLVEENQCLNRFLVRLKESIIEEVAVVSISEVEGLSDSGSVVCMCTCKCLFP